jgi:hypothetical protein
MVELSRLMRKVALELYTRPCEIDQKLYQAKLLEDQLENWLGQVPSYLRDGHQSGQDLSLKPRRHPGFVKKQSSVLRLRYLNLRMVIHAVFMTDAKTALPPNEGSCMRKCQCRCIQAAEDSINLIYTVFCSDDYFQSWYLANPACTSAC